MIDFQDNQHFDYIASNNLTIEQNIVNERECNILSNFIKRIDGAYNFKLVEIIKENDVTIYKYILSSQFWPIEHQNDHDFLWNHRLVIYKPDEILHDTAFMYINGGYNRDENGRQEFVDSPEILDFVGLAARNKAFVVNLLDVPNQYLFFNNAGAIEAKREDQILSYTYKKILENPGKNAYLAGHLPMAKSIIKAMDAVQSISESEYNIKLEKFILSGASKRGWAVWLAALEDSRISAIIPIVIDVLNVVKNITHICNIYGGKCPMALKDYIQDGVIDLLDSENGKKLMEIEDPISYLQDGYDKKYIERLSIPKYIINASGDDFFAPDSSHFYFSKLPGDANYIRYIPNSAHYLLGGKIGQFLKTDVIAAGAVENYLHLVLNNYKLPEVKWEFNNTHITMFTSKAPKNVKLWRAYNEKSRDFRCLQIHNSEYNKLNLMIFFAKKWLISFFTDHLCDAQYISVNIRYNCSENERCVIMANIPKIDKGFQATFLEAEYDLGLPNKEAFTVTTEVNVIAAD